jgi:phosphatidylglycerophosphatase A
VERLIRIIATGFGSGYAPIAPGTAGTIIGIPVYLAVSHFSWPFYLMTLIIFSFLAIYVSREAEKIFNEKDSQRIVIDEIVGLLFTLFLVSPTVVHIALGFALFRLFDIIKIPPADLCQKLPGGYGIVADDVAAGIYANVILLISIKFLGF